MKKETCEAVRQRIRNKKGKPVYVIKPNGKQPYRACLGISNEVTGEPYQVCIKCEKYWQNCRDN